ncbi:FliH/SctL family protein [Govanella unica]|uniref:FliH/SctL family protein n=1 Tax=Govanella unica TaxID=2975056 RepID=A0A9X3TWS0_9PROT|nr:FliH/SctL family protein [Govania unica]MDA5193014.1 FliH/SctL family protein [Govania unica]
MSTEDNIKAVRKFTFSANFAAPKPQKQIIPTFSSEELDVARQAAWAEGEAAGRQAMLGSIEKVVADASVLIAQSLRGLFSEEDNRNEQMKIDATTLAHAFARKIAPRAFRTAPLDEIADMVNDYVALCYNEPRIVIRVADPLVDPLKELSSRIASDQGYIGKIVILGDARLQGSDCKIEWADGGAERNEEKLMHDLDRLVARYMEARRRAIAASDNEQMTEQDHGQQ